MLVSSAIVAIANYNAISRSRALHRSSDGKVQRSRARPRAPFANMALRNPDYLSRVEGPCRLALYSVLKPNDWDCGDISLASPWEGNIKPFNRVELSVGNSICTSFRIALIS